MQVTLTPTLQRKLFPHCLPPEFCKQPDGSLPFQIIKWYPQTNLKGKAGVLLVFLKEFTFLNFQDTQTTLAIVRSYTQIKDRV